MADSKVIDRVRKLLELAKSPNVNEASVAFAQAQKLMARHSISEAMLADAAQPEAEEIENDVLHSDGHKPSVWKGCLATVLCKVNQCMAYRYNENLMIIGRPNDANTVRYLYSYIVREIERLADEEYSQRGRPGRTWKNNFRMGAVETVTERLKEAAKEARAEMRQEADRSDTYGTGCALMVVNSAIAKLDERAEAVNRWAQQNLNLGKSRSTQRFNSEGRNAGRRAGRSINLNGGRAMGAGTRGYLGR